MTDTVLDLPLGYSLSGGGGGLRGFRRFLETPSDLKLTILVMRTLPFLELLAKIAGVFPDEISGWGSCWGAVFSTGNLSSIATPAL